MQADAEEDDTEGTPQREQKEAKKNKGARWNTEMTDKDDAGT